MVNIKLLGLILDEGMHKKANSVLNRLGIKFKTVSNASGTASPSVLDYFGLAQTKKELFLAIIPESLKSKPMYIHLDMSVSGDMTGIAGVFITGKKPPTEGLDQSNDLLYQLGFSVSIKAPKGAQISFEKNKNLIY